MSSVREQAGISQEAISDNPTFESTESPPSEEEAEAEDMADPNSYFDIKLPTSAIAHRHSKSSTDSKDFDFRLCMDNLPDLSASSDTKNLSTADELFYRGQILPLYISQRLHKISSHDTPIAFSYSLHPSDVNLDVLLQPESSSSSCRNSKDSATDSPSHDSGSFLRPKNHPEPEPIPHRNGSRWKLLGHRKRSSKVGASNCEERRLESENVSFSDRRSHNFHDRIPGWMSHSGGFPLPSSDRTLRRSEPGSFYLPRHSCTSGEPVPFRRSSYQSLFRAKEFWKRYLKPFISRSSKPERSSVNLENGKSVSSVNSAAGFNKLKWRGGSRANTPIGSPTHSGILSVSALAPEDVQGAIAYCKASSSG